MTLQRAYRVPHLADLLYYSYNTNTYILQLINEIGVDLDSGLLHRGRGGQHDRLIVAKYHAQLPQSVLPDILQLLQVIDDLIYESHLLVLQFVALRQLLVQDGLLLLLRVEQRLSPHQMVIRLGDQQITNTFVHLVQ